VGRTAKKYGFKGRTYQEKMACKGVSHIMFNINCINGIYERAKHSPRLPNTAFLREGVPYQTESTEALQPVSI